VQTATRTRHPDDDLTERVQAQEDRVAIIDALYRFGAGQDLKDRALFESAFTPDAELDFVQPARKLGVDLAVFKGREHISSGIMAALARLDTTHTVTNPRVEIEGDTATLFALVEAQHLLKTDHLQFLLLKNVYWVKLRRAEQGRWRIAHMRISNVWMDGDPRVLFP
jgi:ketosteroid isomerase-like protein